MDHKTRKIIFDIETLGLDQFSPESRIVAIGYKIDNEPVEVITSIKEHQILSKFWSLPVFKENFVLIGFCNFNFDNPFLIARSFYHNIEMPDIKGKSIDLKYVLEYGNKGRKGTLVDYARLVLGNNVSKYNNGSGANVKELWIKGKVQEIINYCKQDVNLTFAILKRLREVKVL